MTESSSQTDLTEFSSTKKVKKNKNAQVISSKNAARQPPHHKRQPTLSDMINGPNASSANTSAGATSKVGATIGNAEEKWEKRERRGVYAWITNHL